VAELAFIACPFFVDAFVGSTVDADHFAASMVEPDVAAVGTLRTNGGRCLKVPGAGSEAVFAVGEGTDGANFDNVSTEFRGELGFAEGDWLRSGASEAECQLAVAGDFFGESHASGALDTSFQVERDVVGEWECFGGVSLHFYEAAG